MLDKELTSSKEEKSSIENLFGEIRAIHSEGKNIIPFLKNREDILNAIRRDKQSFEEKVVPHIISIETNKEIKSTVNQQESPYINFETLLSIYEKCEIDEILMLSTHLKVDTNIEAFIKLLGEKKLTRLTHLKISTMSDENLTNLSNCLGLNSINHLDLSNISPYGRISEKSINALINSPYLDNITHLDLRGHEVTDQTIIELAESPKFSKLSSLSLGYRTTATLTNGGLSSLVESPYMSNLSKLSLIHCFKLENSEVLIRLAELPKLNQLTIIGNENLILTEILEAFNKSPHIKSVKLNLTEEYETENHHEAGVLRLNFHNSRMPSNLTNLANSVGLRKVTHLNLRNQLEYSSFNPNSTEIAEKLISSPHLDQLTNLDLSQNNLQDEIIIKLANHPNSRNITHLDLSLNYLYGETTIALADSPYLRNITHLDLSENKQVWPGLVHFLQSPNSHKLTHLNLSNDLITVEAMNTLIESPYIKLTSLNLANAIRRGSNEIVNALATSPKFNTVEYLNLSEIEISSETAEILLKSPNFKNLKGLDLSRIYHIGDKMLKTLSENPHLSNLQYLILSRTHLTDEGLNFLEKSPHLRNLTYLDLSFNQIQHKGAKTISLTSHLSRLTHLILDRNYIEDEGVECIAKSPYFNKLSHLSIQSTGVKDKGADALLKSTCPLTHLDTSRNMINPELRLKLGGLPQLTKLVYYPEDFYRSPAARALSGTPRPYWTIKIAE